MPRVHGQNLLAPYPGRSLPPLDLAVMLRTTRRGQLHTGVVTLQDNSLTVLHLGWHNQLFQNEVGSNDMLAVVAPVHTHVPPMRRRAIATLCRRVWTKVANGGLPYAFTEGSQLNSQGDFEPGTHTPPGFTCATFVLALFAAAHYPLTTGQWPAPSTADVAWQQHIAHELTPVAQDHAIALHAAVGKAPRHHPAEVTCAAAADGHPVTWEQLHCSAAWLRTMMQG